MAEQRAPNSEDIAKWVRIGRQVARAARRERRDALNRLIDAVLADDATLHWRQVLERLHAYDSPGMFRCTFDEVNADGRVCWTDRRGHKRSTGCKAFQNRVSKARMRRLKQRHPE